MDNFSRSLRKPSEELAHRKLSSTGIIDSEHAAGYSKHLRRRGTDGSGAEPPSDCSAARVRAAHLPVYASSEKISEARLDSARCLPRLQQTHSSKNPLKLSQAEDFFCSNFRATSEQMIDPDDALATPLNLPRTPTPLGSDSTPGRLEEAAFLVNMDSSLEDKIACNESTPEKPLPMLGSPEEEDPQAVRVASFHFPATKFLSPLGQSSQITALKPLSQAHALGSPV